MWQCGIQEGLFALQDMKYREFQSKLIPNIDIERIIGVRTPQLRSFGKNISKTPAAKQFLASLPHKYYDENNLHGFLISNLKDYDEVIVELDRFLPYIDNWATCDLISPKVFAKNTDRLEPEIVKWLSSSNTYTVRFAIEMLMSFYLDDKFDLKYLEWVAQIRSQEYYINMMIAWYFATALAKQRNATLPFIENKRLDKWVHNKTIQKAVESYRISDEDKAYLKSLREKV